GMEDGGEEEALDGLRRQLGPILAAGSFVRLGVAATPRALIIALQESAVETDPIPRELPHGGATRVRGRVLHPYGDPKAYATEAGGATATVAVARAGPGGFRADIRCGAADGRVKVEVVAEDQRGNPNVLANFPIFCGEPAPRAHALAKVAPAPSDGL